MDEKYIKDNEIISRYLHGRLTPEEVIEFENYLLDKPELVKELEMDEILIKMLPEVDTLESNKPVLFSWFWTRPLGASLATLVLCLLAFQIYVTENVNQPVIDNSGINDLTVYLDTYRDMSTTQSNVVEVLLTGENSRVVFVLQPAEITENKYEIKIFTVDAEKKKEEQVLVLQDLVPQGAGDIIFSITSDKLSTGEYLIELASPINPNIYESIGLRIATK